MFLNFFCEYAMSNVYHYCIYLGRFPYIFSVCLLNLLHIFHTLCSPPHRCSLSCFSIVTTAAFLNRIGFVFGKTWEKLKEQLSACPFSGLESQLCGGKKDSGVWAQAATSFFTWISWQSQQRKLPTYPWSSLSQRSHLTGPPPASPLFC